jgi:hypothetical protein
MLRLLDNEVQFKSNADGLLVLHEQVITPEFLASCKSMREAQADMRQREMNQVASVPCHVIEIWIKQGRDPWNASSREIVQWLEKDSLQAFITTNGKV